MKGLVLFCLLFSIHLNLFAGTVKAQDLIGIKLKSGEVILDLKLKESVNLLKSLENEENIELRDRIIYPEEVSQLITRKLTNGRNSGKRPNPQDYN